MTIDELVSLYGIKTFVASAGDSLRDVSIQLYNSVEHKYLFLLRELNPRLDWDSLSVGVIIQYIPKMYVDYQQLW